MSLILTDATAQAITDLATKWSNSNISGVGTNAIFVREDQESQQSAAAFLAGVIALGAAEYSPGLRFGGFRNEEYNIPITSIICRTSITAFVQTMRELDRVCEAFTADGGPRRYRVRNYTIPTKQDTEMKDEGAYIEARYKGVAVQ